MRYRKSKGGQSTGFLKLLKPFAMQYFEADPIHPSFLRLLLSLLRSDDRMAIIDALAPKVAPKAKRCRWFRENDDQIQFRDSLLEEVDECEHLAGELRVRASRIGDAKAYRIALRRALEACMAKLPRHPAPHPVEKRVDAFCRSMKLREGEKAVLLAAYLENEVQAFRAVLGDFEGTRRIDFISKGCGVPRTEVMQALSNQSMLRACDFIDRHPMSGDLCLSEDVRMYLETGDDASLLNSSCHLATGRGLPLSAFADEVFGLKDCIEACRGLLMAKGPCHIVFYGEPGVGKTQLARALAESCGLIPRFVRDEDGAAERSRVARIEIASRLVDHDRELLMIDEADGVLNTRGGMGFFFMDGGRDRDKGRLNTFLDRSPAKTLWILNESHSLSDAVCRRFHYSWEFRALGEAQRRAIWRRLLAGHPRAALLRPHVEALAARYPIDIGGVKNALNTVNRLAKKNETPEGVLRRLEHLLDRHHHLFRKKAPAPRAREERYDPGLLNTDVPIASVDSALAAICRSWNAGNLEEGTHLNLLFWGPPGTGKTAWAKHLARSLGRDLMVKRASDLQNPYVGMTERNIRDAFLGAAASRSILLIDEADTFLGDRRGHARSWEIAEVNEFLTQMESHTGVLICSTNLLERLDPASKRRFAFKVAFKPLTPEARERVVGLYFPGVAAELAARGAVRLREMDGLTPGDVSAVAAQARHLAPASVTLDWVLERLANEVRYRADGAEKIGFGR
ncbi:MAG: AAA family ATPase [Spirochaetes bacterium]|nr:AAA family ATPase [Spirochaetota bacterium]